jgi:hypothetical membrane protein
MHLEDRQWAGLLLFAGTAQFVIGMTAAQVMYPAFNITHDFLGDLGVGPTALLFNASIVSFGIAFVAAAGFLFRAFRSWPLTMALALAGIGAIGFGLVPASDNFTPGVYGNLPVHTGAAFLSYLFGSVAAILAFRILRTPVRYVSVVLGVVSLVALGLMMSKIYLGLDRGGMERMIVWPVLVWGMAAGGSLLTVVSISRRGSPSGAA